MLRILLLVLAFLDFLDVDSRSIVCLHSHDPGYDQDECPNEQATKGDCEICRVSIFDNKCEYWCDTHLACSVISCEVQECVNGVGCNCFTDMCNQVICNLNLGNFILKIMYLLELYSTVM